MRFFKNNTQFFFLLNIIAENYGSFRYYGYQQWFFLVVLFFIFFIFRNLLIF